MAEKKKRSKQHPSVKTALVNDLSRREAFIIFEPHITAITTGCDVLHFLLNNSAAPNREDQICWVVDRIRDGLAVLQNNCAKK